MSFLKSISRRILKQWGHIGLKNGYFYQTMEKYGSKLGSGEPLQAILPNGLTMNCDLKDHVQRHIYYSGVYEPIEAHLFCRLISEGQTVFDVGSNVGQYALLASTLVGPSGRVYAFEPVPKNHSRNAAHLQSNRVNNVFLQKLAAWNKRGELELGLASDMTENDGSFSIGAVTSSAVEPIKATAVPLDDFVSENKIPQIHLVKMDIEGAELSALEGFRQTLKRDHPVLLMEVNKLACERMGYRPQALWDLIVKDLGYRPWKIGKSATEWTELLDPSSIEQANCLFTFGDLPECISNSWTVRSCLAWGGSAGNGDKYLRRMR
jgi:FkbM family methyltransferase